MYSPRQRDLRERRIHQHFEAYQIAVEPEVPDADELIEPDAAPSWVTQLSARPSAA